MEDESNRHVDQASVNDVIDEIVEVNRKIAAILDAAMVAIQALDLTLPSMAYGYDLVDMPALIADMIPRYAQARTTDELRRDELERRTWWWKTT